MRIKRRKAPRHGINKGPQREFHGHTKWVRGHECLINNDECRGNIDAAHFDGPVPNEDRGGMALKDHDKWTFPLCRFHHIFDYHNGWQTFEKKHGVDTKKAAEEMAGRSPHRFKWLEVK